MAWIEQHRRADGNLTARVIWRPGGTRDATRLWETFGAGSDAQNLARADGFKRMVEAAGQRWPDGWVKGEGFVRPPDVADPMTPPPSFDKIGEEYVRQIVDLSPGQRKRYLGQLQVLARTPVRGSLIFAGPITAIGEAQVKTWLIEWDRSLKTKANYHGLIYGVFAYAVQRGSAGACRPQQRRAVSCARYVPGLAGLSRPVVRSFSRARWARAAELWCASVQPR